MTLNTAVAADSLAHQELDDREMTYRGTLKEGANVYEMASQFSCLLLVLCLRGQFISCFSPGSPVV